MMSDSKFTNYHKRRRIQSESIILVPYREHHVPKYHQWMQNSELLYLTNSEPLTLEEEFKNLESWTNDPYKCTFIIIDRHRFDLLRGEINDIEDVKRREVQSMIGDVNIFWLQDDEANDVGEIEVMIAEKSARNRGFGREATILMLKFAYEVVGLRRFQAKIKMTNRISQKLFTETLGFKEVSRSEIFDEITYRCDFESNNALLALIIGKKNVIDVSES